MNIKHSEPFHISSHLFDNRRLKRRINKWMERLRERQQLYLAQMRSKTSHSFQPHTPASKTDTNKRRRCHQMLSRRHVAATLPADITIDLLSDDDAECIQFDDSKALSNGVHTSANLLTVPNIAPAQFPTLLLMPGTRSHGPDSNLFHRHCANITSSTTTAFAESIVLTSDDDDSNNAENSFVNNFNHRYLMRSPPPLAPLTFSDSAIEEVTVSLVPRNSTTANCQARLRRQKPREHKPKACESNTNSCTIPATNISPRNNYDGFLRVDVSGDDSVTLPDETTVHTVIANRIYELSLSKLREGLAFSGVPEYAHDLLPEQLQKLSPAMRAKVAPMVTPATPPAPISLKLSSDLSISLISDDDDCDSVNIDGGKSTDALQPVVAAAEAHAAAKLLKQQQPQLSVVQHLQYPGYGSPVALPVMALAATPPSITTPSSRRRKLG